MNIFETHSLLDVNARPKALIKLNAHSLPVSDLFLEEDLLFSSSSDFTVKIWSLQELKAKNDESKENKIKQSSLLLSTVDFPAAVTSLTLEGSMKTMFVSKIMDRNSIPPFHRTISLNTASYQTTLNYARGVRKKMEGWFLIIC